jgi:hypothetical protein
MLIPIPEFYPCSFFMFRDGKVFQMDFNMPTEVGILLDEESFPAWAAVLNFIETNFQKARAEMD